MHRPSPDIYASEFHALVDGIITDLKQVAVTDSNLAIYIANGHGAWEAVVTNLFSPHDSVLVLSTGPFAAGWGGFAQSLGVKTQVLDFGMQAAIDMERVAQTLIADRHQHIKAVIATQVDTASSVRNDIKGLAATIRDTGHHALLLVDTIASLGCEEFLMDEWGVDVAIAASQKGLMLPPGLAFVYFNERAMRVGAKAALRTPYWDWNRRVQPDEFYQLFCGTAPTQLIFGLRESLDMILKEEGLANTMNRHALLARSVWSAVDAWGGDTGTLQCNIADHSRRSHAVTAVHTGAPFGTQLRHWLSSQAGVSLGIGLGMATKTDPAATGSFRIGHMGYVNPGMLLGLLAAIEAGFAAINYPRGRGAVEAAAAQFAHLPLDYDLQKPSPTCCIDT
ncbi:MAG: aminotransferase class V-fold PLP-dependent enzyme [Rhodobacteraceae bacterium]|nr:aminotransferase class V-fold PLP-dependent enzyme [Paracoccaceae bacterium]MCY4195540.1 aminotransferase class V-fold PLP-dependent enzyme [Paracoccaceae bacterium]